MSLIITKSWISLKKKKKLFDEQATQLTRVQQQVTSGFAAIMGILSNIQNAQANSTTSQIAPVGEMSGSTDVVRVLPQVNTQ